MECLIGKFQEKEGNDLVADGLIRITGNPSGDGVERGSMMLVSPTIEISGRFVNERNKVGFITGEVTTLNKMIAKYGLKEGVDFSQAVAPHRIVTIEKLETEVDPDDQSFNVKAVPESNEAYGGTVLTKNGVPIVWKREVVPEGSDLVDTLIKHDDLASADTSGTPNEEFEREGKAGKRDLTKTK